MHRAFCAGILRQNGVARVDAIFTSETYGPGFAADLARRQNAPVAHILVDAARSRVPISGTAIRADVHGLRHFLSPEVYASFVQRVAILGGESTGKSTLTKALAEAHHTTYVAEYGRELWEERSGNLGFDDMLMIAGEQVRREEGAMRSPLTNRYVFCDTTPLTTRFYSEQMFGRVAPELQRLAERPYDHTVLCAADFSFIQDGTRRDTAFREVGQDWYRLQLAASHYYSATGSLRERVDTVTRALSATRTRPD